MVNSTKKQKVAYLHNCLIDSKTQAIFCLNFNNISADKMNHIRRICRQNQAQLIVAKNNLVKIASHESWCSDITTTLKGNIALVLAQDPVITAKDLQSIIQNHRSATIQYTQIRNYKNQFNGLELYYYLQSIPSQPTVTMQTLNTIAQPITTWLRTCESPMRCLIHALTALQSMH